MNLKNFDMTQEEKQLLLIDLCARLPYGVNITDGLHTITLKADNIEKIAFKATAIKQIIDSGHILPYLRPMSSITEEERGEENRLWNIITKTRNDLHYLYTDFLLSHHLDYRGLIPMGLALEASEGMYSIK